MKKGTAKYERTCKPIMFRSNVYQIKVGQIGYLFVKISLYV